ncbi:ubiquinol-cytochrome c reductase iron-sulfur subunit [Jannaschia aquimarina]|uniref:Ubiquinol-cytochrome c reductase iron-sulfur subunit n=1 Tax=Jannaschia aquimarina TaxID=935700 RepID=A0A0D1EGN0_9RHOB|nr:ubiquinol-cytochrome c reductase iron-sulfur subunit [Jannaschia aquimarina]KIT15005.1 Ubiquinol-cytochrome c reductase iron-sulfur subunit [Jannaschia aquimarina]SNS61757.1 ubiquinol-cytochrome c reductase iron-sulfur subunit [Jannaschia aquimarina]
MSQAEDQNYMRRDFLYYATGAAGVVVTGAAVWPLINQMNPSADVLALSTIPVDVAGLEPGTQITAMWLGKPVFIRRRTEEEIAAARETDGEVDSLPDPLANNENIEAEASAADENRSIADFSGENTGEWLVMMGVCTHLGCVPLGNAGDFGGWFCPCHGSHYDTAGRIRRGPAPRNLPVPPAQFTDETTILLG